MDLTDEIMVQDEPMGPLHVLKGFIATLVLQDTLVHMAGLMESMAHACVLPISLTTSQHRGGAQTPATHSLE